MTVKGLKEAARVGASDEEEEVREAVAEAVAVSRVALGGHCYLELAVPNPVGTRMIRSASSRSVYFSQNSMKGTPGGCVTSALGRSHIYSLSERIQ